ncbi:T9SS type A sorting domain-containing protein [Psychroserpens sp.]|uniref:T9SS type A sorting domain-containing protein n=1 Tax=Psychroserpens sp. TaxID=2020870 RepID=UPI002B270CA6|nr:T9SS type A sorting domain-containing protein [Psychroserpens sp.]
MKNLYILLITILLTGSAQAQLGTTVFSVGEDDANNYGGSWGTTNQGTGFSDWTFDTATPGGGFAGRFIGSFSTALDVSGDSFGMFANSGNGAVSGATTTMPKSLEEGDSFVVSVGVNFRDGNKGFDLRNSANATIINFNVGSDEYNITGTSGLYGNAYDSNTVITFTFTQNATDVSWTAVRSGGSSGSESGTIGSISPGTIENIRFYNVSAGTNNDGGAGQRNLFVNSLEFYSLYTVTGNSTVSSSGNITVPYLDVQSGSTLNIPSNSNVTVSGNLNNSGALNLASTSTQYSSIIPNSATGTITYNRYVNSNANGNDLVSSPVTQSWASFLTTNGTALLDDGNTGPTTYAFGPFNKTTGAYENYTDATSATLTSGTGYRAATDSGATLAFSGTTPTGSVAVDILNSGPQEQEWNLVGNPYPSYINVQDFLNHEVSTGVSNLSLFNSGTAAIYGYDGDASNGWTIYNLATTTAATVIAPGQGFFVSADATNAPLYDLEFTPSMRSTGTTDDFIVGRNANGTLIHFTLNLSSNTNSFDTEFYFNPNASAGFDLGFDAELFTNPPFSVFSYLVEENEGDAYQIQALHPSNLDDTTIPLGVRASQGVQLTFSMSLNELPPTIEIFLDDVVANTTTLLNTSDYVFTPATQLAGAGRFFIRTNDTSLSTIENSLDTLNIYALNDSKELVVSGQLQNNTMLNLYDIQGRLVLSTKLDSTVLQNRIDVSSLSGGIYVVNVQNNNQEKSQKVILK